MSSDHGSPPRTADREPAAWRKRLGVFAVERFTDAEALRERFDVPADFRLDQVLHGAFGIHVQSDNEPRRVVIEFSKEKAMLVRARVWHPSQQLEDLPDGGVRFSFSCSNLTPVVSWILEWGPHARVLSPDELRTQVVNELDRARALYA
jgi:predicted DNA-binding transcriptional regulator YafY